MQYFSEADVEARIEISALVEGVEGVLRGVPRIECGRRTSDVFAGGRAWAGASWASCEEHGVAILKASSEVRVGDRRPGNSIVVLMDLNGAAPAAVMAAERLTAARTAAAVLAAARLLGRGNPKRVALLGAGLQAQWQLKTLGIAAAAQEIAVWARDAAKAEEMIDGVGQSAVPVSVAPSVAEAVHGAHLIIVATSASAPILDASQISEGAHVAAIGSHDGSVRELAESVLTRAAAVFVDSPDAALSGDLAGPIARGALAVSDLRFLRDPPPKLHTSDITVWKSVGRADQDLMAARLAWENANSSVA